MRTAIHSAWRWRRCRLALAAAAGSGAALVRHLPQRHGDDGPARRSSVKLSGARCDRGGSDHALRDRRRQADQGMLLPHAGDRAATSRSRATMRLLSGTPKSAAPQGLPRPQPARRATARRYQLPSTRSSARPSCARCLPTAASNTCTIEKDVAAIKGVDKANKLRLRAFNVTAARTRAAAGSSPASAASRSPKSPMRAAGRTQGPRLGLRGRRDQERQGRVGSVDDVVDPRPEPRSSAGLPLSDNPDDVDDDDRAAAQRRARLWPGRRLAGDRPQRQPQHLRARRRDAGRASSRASASTRATRSPTRSTTAARRSSGAARASPPSTTGSSSTPPA